MNFNATNSSDNIFYNRSFQLHNDIVISVSYIVKISVSLLGFVLSFCAFVFFHRYGRLSHFCAMLQQLSLVESIFCLTGALFEGCYFRLVVQRHEYGPLTTQLLVYGVLYVTWLVYKSSLLARNWLLVLVAWRRYQVINKPLNSQRGFSTSTLQLAALLIYIFSLLLVLPRLFEVRYEPSSPVRLSSLLLRYRAYSSSYPTLFFLLISPVPICAILLFSGCMLHTLHRASYRRSPSSSLLTSSLPASLQTSRSRRNTASANRTVLVLCAVFTLCEVPMCVAGILSQLPLRLPTAVIHFAGIANILTSLDSICNFLIYFFSFAFFKQTLTRYCCKHRSPPPAATGTAAAVDCRVIKTRINVTNESSHSINYSLKL